MDLHPRHALIAVAIVLTLVLPARFTSTGTIDGAAPPTRLEPFPAAVAAVPLEPLPAYADGAWTRVNQQFASINAMWGQLYDGAGADYDAPKLAREVPEDCGSSSPWAGIYCGASRTVVIDLPAHVQRHVNAGAANSDLALGYIVAHEVGHHVQLGRGAPRSGALEAALRRELHATCLAGLWGKAAGLSRPPGWFYAEDAEHGTRTQQIQWLNVGYGSGRPADCDAIWSPSTSP